MKDLNLLLFPVEFEMQRVEWKNSAEQEIINNEFLQLRIEPTSIVFSVRHFSINLFIYYIMCFFYRNMKYETALQEVKYPWKEFILLIDHEISSSGTDITQYMCQLTFSVGAVVFNKRTDISLLYYTSDIFLYKYRTILYRNVPNLNVARHEFFC